MKQCYICRELKADNAFYRHPTTLDGLHSDCIKCRIKGSQDRRERIKADPVLYERQKKRDREREQYRYQQKKRNQHHKI